MCTLELTGTVYVPIKASMEDETLTYTNPDNDEQSTRDVSAYHVSEYLQMEYTIPVKGVIKSSSQGYSYLDAA